MNNRFEIREKLGFSQEKIRRNNRIIEIWHF